MSDRPPSARALLARAPFGLFGIHPRAWDGPAMIGAYSFAGERIREIGFVYLDQIDERSMGIGVTNLDGSAKGVDAIEVHLLDLVSRFDDEYLVARVKRRRFEPFPPGDFSTRAITASLAGRTVGATVYEHASLPLRLLRAAVRLGDAVTDVGIAGWRLDPLDHVSSVVPVDVRFADELDAQAPRIVTLDDGE